MTHRAYNITFPFKPSFLQRLAIEAGVKNPKYASALAHLKPGIRAKLEACAEGGDPEFTKADFDSLDDKTWAALEPHL